MTKTFVGETVIDLVRDAMAIHGSYGLINDYKISQLWRDSTSHLRSRSVTDMQKTIAQLFCWELFDQEQLLRDGEVRKPAIRRDTMAYGDAIAFSKSTVGIITLISRRVLIWS